MTFWRFVFWAGVLGLCLMIPPLFFVVLIMYALKRLSDTPGPPPKLPPSPPQVNP